MKTVLLVISCEEFGRRLTKELERDYRVFLCRDAKSADICMEQRPDAVIVQMELPGVSGVGFLEQLTRKPPVIFSLAYCYPPCSAVKLQSLGVSQLIQMPCRTRSVVSLLHKELSARDNSQDSPQSGACSGLRLLPVSSKVYRHHRADHPLTAIS